MSLILDALRKSDVERARKEAPGIGAPTSGNQTTQRSIGLWILLAVLLINAVLLAWLLMKPAPSSATTTTTLPTTPVRQPTISETPTVVTATEVPPQKAPVRSLIDESQRGEPAATTVATTPVTTTPTSTSTAVSASNTAPASNQPYQEQPATLELPTMNELILSNRLSLEPMVMDLHVYSDRAERRFAFVDGQKVSAGSQLPNGVKIERVSPSGVVMRYRGQQFLLPRR